MRRVSLITMVLTLLAGISPGGEEGAPEKERRVIFVPHDQRFAALRTNTA